MLDVATLLTKITAQSMQKIEEEGCTREKKINNPKLLEW